MKKRPLYHLPRDDAPISEWCRPLSASLTTRSPLALTATSIPLSHGYGYLGQKLKKMARRKIAEDRKRGRYAP